MATQNLLQIFADIRVFFLGALQNLPLAVAGTLLFLGLMTANYGMLFLVLAMLTVVPATTLALNFAGDLLSNLIPMDWFEVTPSELCDLIIDFAATSNRPQVVISTYWSSMTFFFLAYVLTNAVYLYSMPANIPKDATDELKQELQSKVSLRNSQAILCSIVVLLFAIMLVLYRLNNGCESILSLLISIAVFSSIGVGWYSFLSSIGNNRLSDLFGVANRLLSPQAYGSQPLACLPMS